MSLQVSNAVSEFKNQDRVWWLEALHHAEQNNDFSKELIRKIEESITGSLKNSRSSKMTSRSVSLLAFNITSPEQAAHA